SGGIANVISTLSLVSERMFATVSQWNFSRRRAGASVAGIMSVHLEIVERFQARIALVERLAARRAEPGELAGFQRTAVRAFHRQLHRDRARVHGRLPGRRADA